MTDGTVILEKKLMSEAAGSVISSAVRDSLKSYGLKTADSSLPEWIAVDVCAALRAAGLFYTPTVPEAFRGRAINLMVRWREMASDYEGADKLRHRDPDELKRSAKRIEEVAYELHMGIRG